jgi:hypothetical protein
VHHQATQEGAEFLEVLAVQRVDAVVVRSVVLRVVPLAGRDAMVNLVEADADRDHDRDHRECIEERGQHRRHRAEQQ